MEKYVKELFTEEVLEITSKLYGIEREDLYIVGGFENYIYGFDKDNKSYIVRITHNSHRTVDQVKAEMDFLFYLAKSGANVSMPITTINNSFVETIECLDNSHFIICAFTKAEGERPNRTNLTNEMFYNYGRTVGLFHKLTKNYRESEGIVKRYNWDEDTLIVNASKYLSSDDQIILERLDEVIQSIKMIEKTKDNFGLIHTDIHMGNFFVKNNELTVFDFDDVSYQYFISDIAIALFYLVFMVKEEQQVELADRFLTHFMKGYLSIIKISKSDYMKMPIFLKLRELILYVVIFRTLNVQQDEFARVFIDRYRNRIINKTPFINLDLEKYYFD